MARMQAWFQRWWPIFAAASPIIAGAMLWWLAQYFVTEKAHAADIATLRSEAHARWESHTIWADEVLKRYSGRMDLSERSFAENSVEHKEIMKTLAAIREDIAALKAQRVGVRGAQPDLGASGKPTSGVLNW